MILRLYLCRLCNRSRRNSGASFLEMPLCITMLVPDKCRQYGKSGALPDPRILQSNRAGTLLHGDYHIDVLEYLDLS